MVYLVIHVLMGFVPCSPSIWLLAFGALVSSSPQSAFQMRQDDQIHCSGAGLALQGAQVTNLTNFAAATKVVFSKTFYTGPLESDTPILPKFIMEWVDERPNSDMIWAIAVQPTLRENESTPIVDPVLWEFVSTWTQKLSILLSHHR